MFSSRDSCGASFELVVDLARTGDDERDSQASPGGARAVSAVPELNLTLRCCPQRRRLVSSRVRVPLSSPAPENECRRDWPIKAWVGRLAMRSGVVIRGDPGRDSDDIL